MLIRTVWAMKPRAGVSGISTAGLSWAQAIPNFLNACSAGSSLKRMGVSFETSAAVDIVSSNMVSWFSQTSPSSAGGTLTRFGDT